MSGNVKVVSRFRPPNALEMREGGDIVVDFVPPEKDGEETVKVPGATNAGSDALSGFTFDRVFPMGTMQRDVFEFGIRETVDGEWPLVKRARQVNRC
jgi:kinesin family member 5